MGHAITSHTEVKLFVYHFIFLFIFIFGVEIYWQMRKEVRMKMKVAFKKRQTEHIKYFKNPAKNPDIQI